MLKLHVVTGRKTFFHLRRAMMVCAPQPFAKMTARGTFSVGVKLSERNMLSYVLLLGCALTIAQKRRKAVFLTCFARAASFAARFSCLLARDKLDTQPVHHKSRFLSLVQKKRPSYMSLGYSDSSLDN